MPIFRASVSANSRRRAEVASRSEASAFIALTAAAIHRGGYWIGFLTQSLGSTEQLHQGSVGYEWRSLPDRLFDEVQDGSIGP
jgi:hypothetical protein